MIKKSNWDDVEIPDPEPIGYSLGFNYQVIDSSTGTIKFTFKKPLLRYWYLWAKGRLNFSTPWEVIPTSVVYVTDRDNNVEVTCTGCPNYMFSREPEKSFHLQYDFMGSYQNRSADICLVPACRRELHL